MLKYFQIIIKQGCDQSDPVLTLQASFLQEQILYSVSILSQVLLLTSGNPIIWGLLQRKHFPWKNFPVDTEFLSSELHAALFIL